MSEALTEFFCFLVTTVTAWSKPVADSRKRRIRGGSMITGRWPLQKPSSAMARRPLASMNVTACVSKWVGQSASRIELSRARAEEPTTQSIGPVRITSDTGGPSLSKCTEPLWLKPRPPPSCRTPVAVRVDARGAVGAPDVLSTEVLARADDASAVGVATEIQRGGR